MIEEKNMQDYEEDAKSVELFLKAQDRYFYENWLKILAYAAPVSLKCFFIRDEVVNGHVYQTMNIITDYLIVRVLFTQPRVKPGCYQRHKDTIQRLNSRSTWVDSVPDVSVIEPNFSLLAKQYPSLVRIPREACPVIVGAAKAVLAEERSIVVKEDGLFIGVNNECLLPYNFLVTEPFRVHPSALIAAFTEAQRYESVYAIRQHDSARSMPFFVGVDWLNCCMVSTEQGMPHALYARNSAFGSLA
jgi:hypothetical protein